MIAYYEERAAAHGADRDREASRSRIVSRLRLATVIPGIALILYGGARTASPWPLTAGIILLAIFFALVVWHARIEARVAWHDALYTVNRIALARIGRAWDLLPAAEAQPPGTDHHPYAHDLDVFGRASLMQWLGPAATAAGGSTLSRWLLAPATPPEIAARQQAVEALSSAVEWREHLAAHGRLAAGIRRGELEGFLAWAESSGPFSSAAVRRLRIAVLLIVAAIWSTMILQASGVVDAALWMLPVTVGVVLSFATAAQVHGEFNRANVGEHAFSRYAELFAHAAAAPATALLLQQLHTRLAGSGASAPVCMRSLMRILGFSHLRTGAAIFHFPIQALTLWDFHVFFALDAWRRRVGSRVRGWMEALGDLDALSAFAQIKRDNPSWCFPELQEVGEGEPAGLTAKALAHPLIPDDRRVANDVTVGPAGTLLLITGSNMSGKSTLLRSIGVNAVLAQAGAPVCATHMRLPPVDVETSIRVQDSLEHGLSYFMAALARLKGVLDRARMSNQSAHGRVVMYLLDEILQGTNTAERSIAVRAVAQHLLDAGAIGVITTHDLGLASETPLSTSARLVHFSDTVDPRGGMTFDYRLRPGLATSRNALRLMQLIGIDLKTTR